MSRTIQQIDTECAQAVVELGRKVYHRHLLDREIAELQVKVYDLNVEAFKTREALEAAKAQLAAEAAEAVQADASTTTEETGNE